MDGAEIREWYQQPGAAAGEPARAGAGRPHRRVLRRLGRSRRRGPRRRGPRLLGRRVRPRREPRGCDRCDTRRARSSSTSIRSATWWRAAGTGGSAARGRWRSSSAWRTPLEPAIPDGIDQAVPPSRGRAAGLRSAAGGVLDHWDFIPRRSRPGASSTSRRATSTRISGLWPGLTTKWPAPR